MDRGLVSWLVTDYLPRKELRMYGLEYSTALLMNLCLHKAGKTQCVPIANNVLEVLVRLVVRDLKQVFLKSSSPCFKYLYVIYLHHYPFASD